MNALYTADVCLRLKCKTSRELNSVLNRDDVVYIHKAVKWIKGTGYVGQIALLKNGYKKAFFNRRTDKG